MFLQIHLKSIAGIKLVLPGQTCANGFTLNVSLSLRLCVQDASLDQLLTIGSHGQFQRQTVLAGDAGAQSRCDCFPCQLIMMIFLLSKTTC